VEPSAASSQGIPAQLDGKAVVILDIDATSALIEHSFQLVTTLSQLRFDWMGEEISIEVRSASSQLQGLLSDREQRLIYHTAVVFSGDSEALHRALYAREERRSRALEANFSGTTAPDSEETEDIGAGLRARRIGYVAHVLRDGKWRRFETLSPDQPLTGFTVAAHEDEGQLNLLRLAYEEADGEGRKLLRQFAAESIKSE
jgi:hypothetical protein